MQKFHLLISLANWRWLPLLFVPFFTACEEESFVTEVSSPESVNKLVFSLSEAGEATYTVTHKEELVIDESSMGFEFADQDPLQTGLEIVGSSLENYEEEWVMPWGEQRTVTNAYNELVLELQEKEAPNRRIDVYFRAYDDGVAFRYAFLDQEGVDSVRIVDEHTQFQLTGDHNCWWIPGDWDIYEHLYNTTLVSEIDALSKQDHPNLAQTTIPFNAVNTPVTMRTASGLHLSFHEANLTDYSGMTLKVDNDNLLLTSGLVGSDLRDFKVSRALPFKTPWRTIQIGDEATDLLDSRLIVNLNEPNKLGDVSWFEPQTYIGIWWEMHTNRASWDYGMTMNDEGQWEDTGEAHGRHGATTENTKRYIDFAAANNIGGVLVEGWNTGWERWIGFDDREGVFDFVTPYPDYDIEELSRYAQEKGVDIIMHHETSAAPRTYDQQLDAAYELMKSNGMHVVKTGYVGPIIPTGEFHHGQWMVNHYRRVLETAAAYEVAINAHEPIKDTGLRRTYPNAVSREGLRGQEFNAWAADGGNPPEHLPIVAFTRMLAGPIDFTPGVFEIDLPTKPDNQINTTLAQQLGLYVVIYSPIQMACDIPESYENQVAFQFIREVGVDWEQSLALDGEVGDYVVMAREERDSGDWFVGGISDENSRTYELDFDFLDDEATYVATLYSDAADAHYRDNPTAIQINQFEVRSSDSRTIEMAPGGGFAISLMRQE
ncbi:MAG: glycoside hydrolase family 97 protein [Bacteroidota bacterium]